jgi:hypothetical protein
MDGQRVKARAGSAFKGKAAGIDWSVTKAVGCEVRGNRG